MLELCRFQMFKKRRENSSSFLNWIQSLLDDNKANTNNTNHIKGESKTGFWHKSANKSHFSLAEKQYSDVDIKKSNLEGKQSYHKGLTLLESKLI